MMLGTAISIGLSPALDGYGQNAIAAETKLFLGVGDFVCLNITEPECEKIVIAWSPQAQATPIHRVLDVRRRKHHWFFDFNGHALTPLIKRCNK